MMSRLGNHLKNKKGFTLMEMIIAMAVSTVLMLGIAFVLPSFVKMQAASIELSYAKLISDGIEEALENELAFSRDVSVSEDKETLTYTGAYGKKTINGSSNPVTIEGLSYDARYYMNKQVNIDFSLSEDGQLCSADITVSNESGKLLYQSVRTIRLHAVPDKT